MIRYSTNIPVENWALEGTGNVSILHRMVECDLKNKFTDNDLILVQWSSWTREDRFIGKWTQGGSVLNHVFYDKNFVDKYWNWNNDIVKNSTAIITANKSFNIGYQYTFYNWPEAPDFDASMADLNTELQSLYLSNLPKMDTFPIKQSTAFGGNSVDGHADIIGHLSFFNNYIKPKFGFELGRKEDELVNLSNVISNNLKLHQGWPAQKKIITKLVKLFDPTISKEIGFGT
jgi:hypothetical protein